MGALHATKADTERIRPNVAAAGLGEGEIAEFVEDEVEAREIIGEPSLAASARLSLELIDEIDGGEEAPARSGSDAASRDGDGQMRLAGAGSPDQDDIALLGDEAAGGEVAHEAPNADRRNNLARAMSIAGTDLFTAPLGREGDCARPTGQRPLAPPLPPRAEFDW